MKHKIYFFPFLIFLSLSQLFGQETFSNNKQNGIIPIEYRGHIYVKGKVNNVEGNFVFDTGADNLYFDSLFYDKSHFSYDSIAIAKLPGAGTGMQTVEVILNSVDFNSGEIDYKTNVVPIMSLKTILGDFADGILGLDYFSDKVLEINYQKNYMKVHHEIDSLTYIEYSKIQCQKIGNKLFVPLTVHINDSISISEIFTLDLGSGGSVSITSPVALKNGFDKCISKKVKYHTKYGGVGGESESYGFYAKSIEVGGYKLSHFGADYSLDKSGALASTKHAGLLGNDVLERFDVIIDFKSSCLYLKPNAKFSEDYSFSRLGFSYIDRSKTFGAWIVTGLYENSSAEKCGLQIDDKIIAIDGKDINNIDYNQQKEHIKKASKLKLKIIRNNIKRDMEIQLNPILK